MGDKTRCEGQRGGEDTKQITEERNQRDLCEEGAVSLFRTVCLSVCPLKLPTVLHSYEKGVSETCTTMCLGFPPSLSFIGK